jgi:thioredoxin 1
MTRRSGSAIVATTVQITGIASGDINVSSQGPVDLQSGDAWLTFAGGVADGDAATPVTGTSGIAAAVAGSPTAPLELVDALRDATWEGSTESYDVFNIVVPKQVASKVMKTDEMASRLSALLGDPQFFDKATTYFRVSQIEGDTRIRTANLFVSSGGVSIRTTTSFTQFGIALDPQVERQLAGQMRLDVEGDEGQATKGQATKGQEVERLIATSSKPVIVMYGTSWCPNCHSFSPKIARAASAHGKEFDFAVLDVELYPEVGHAGQIAAVPDTYMYFKGEPVDHFTGSVPYAKFANWMTKHGGPLTQNR